LHEGRGIAPSELETQARRNGTGFAVNGFKSPVMFPQSAVVSVIIARDEGGALVGLIIENLDGAVEFRGAGRGRKLAMNACPTAVEARIRDLRAPPESVLPTEGLHRALTICRLAHACVCIGTAAAATRFAGEWGQKRIAFGKPLVGFQGVSFPLVNLVLEADAARLSVLQLATATLMGSAELERGANEIVAHANQLIADATREGVQMMGVHGVLQEHPQERFYRSAAVLASIDFDPLTCGFAIR
jgi:alkylation response protein AidB-like acyl-CoA dehydrogenase